MFPNLAALGAPVAQLDRASDYGSEGLGFDSLRVYHFFYFLSHQWFTDSKFFATIPHQNTK